MKKVSSKLRKMLNTIKKEHCIEHDGKIYISFEDFDNFLSETIEFIIQTEDKNFKYDFEEMSSVEDEFNKIFKI